MFNDRREAGQLLARRLAHLKGKEAVVLALPRGGVVVGYEVAQALQAPLDILVARKLGAPGDPELAIGAVAEGDQPQSVLLNQALMAALGVSPEYLRSEVARQLQEISRRQAAYRGGLAAAEVEGRTALLVDDGIATGASTRAALRALRRRGPKKIVLAVPVAPSDTVRVLRPEVEELVCLEEPEPFLSVGSHYLRFEQTTDEEVVALLESARRK